MQPRMTTSKLEDDNTATGPQQMSAFSDAEAGKGAAMEEAGSNWPKHLAVMVASITYALVVNLTAQTEEGWEGWWADFVRQYPKSGEAGLGTFVIRGASGNSTDYPWRLAQPSLVGTLLAWALFVVHTALQWAVIMFARRAKNAARDAYGVPRYSSRLDLWNGLMAFFNVVCIGLGYVHKRFYYDGLAGTLNESVAQNAVVLYLGIVLLMETPRRGVFFGRGRSYFCFRDEVQKALLRFLVQNHGYLFSLAFTLNLHYQAIESTSSHFFGYFYQMLLILQGTLLFNNAHKDRRWTFWLECLVVLHAVGVAVIQNTAAVCMFGFGFSLVTLVSQLWGHPAVQDWLFEGEDATRATKANVGVPLLLMSLWGAGAGVCAAKELFGAIGPAGAVLIPAGLAVTYVVVAILFWLGYRLSRKANSAVLDILLTLVALAITFVVSVALVGGGKPGLHKFALPSCGEAWPYSNGTHVALSDDGTCFI